MDRGERCKLQSRPRCLRLWAEGGSNYSVATCDSNSFFENEICENTRHILVCLETTVKHGLDHFFAQLLMPDGP
jgi:hypothetical protein